MDAKIDALTGDIDLSTGDIVLTEGSEAIAQHMRIRFSTILGEYFLDKRIGVPYFQSLMIKNPKTNVVRGILQEVALGTPGVEAVNDLALDFDGATRALSVTLRATIIGSEEPLVFDEVLIV